MTAEKTQAQTEFSGWAKVEVMGHQSHIGFVKTEAYGAAVLFRIDAPALPEREYTLASPEYVDGTWTRAGAKVRRAATAGHSVLVGAGSIYRIIPCTEDAALLAIERETRAELKLIEPPPTPQLEAASSEPEDDGDEPEDDGDESRPF